MAVKSAEPAAPEATEPEPAPTNVIEAICRVMVDLPGIGKNDRSSDAQGGYNYRGIEAITRHAQERFGRYGVVFVPHVEDVEIVELTVNNKPWTDTHLTVVYTVYGPGGVTDKIEVGPIHAIGRDNTDKGANKAMTQAFKQVLLQVLCVGDGKDDPDASGATNAADHRGHPQITGSVADMKPAEIVAALRKLGAPLGGTPDELRARLTALMPEPATEPEAGAEAAQPASGPPQETESEPEPPKTEAAKPAPTAARAEEVNQIMDFINGLTGQQVIEELTNMQAPQPWGSTQADRKRHLADLSVAALDSPPAEVQSGGPTE